MFGFLNINKPSGITSHSVVYKLRKILGTKKVGHLGTLDPMATGVLPIAIGKATKLIPYIDTTRKAYKSSIIFGISTDSLDITGNITEIYENIDYSEKLLSIDFKTIFDKFRGEQYMEPPMLSAKKVNGQRLYKLFRNGKNMEWKKELINIYDIYVENQYFLKKDDLPEIAKSKDGLNFEKYFIVEFFADVSKGTYIRSIVNEISKEIEIFGTTLSINRVNSGSFLLENTINIEDVKIESIEKPDKYLNLEKLIVKDEILSKILNGNEFLFTEIENSEFIYNHIKNDINLDEVFYVLDNNNRYIAIAKIKYININRKSIIFKIIKLFVDGK